MLLIVNNCDIVIFLRCSQYSTWFLLKTRQIFQKMRTHPRSERTKSGPSLERVTMVRDDRVIAVELFCLYMYHVIGLQLSQLLWFLQIRLEKGSLFRVSWKTKIFWGWYSLMSQRRFRTNSRKRSTNCMRTCETVQTSFSIHLTSEPS